ncbi:NAD(P)/FAD-dependent oxidoreductase [Actinomadura fibrosa]|uniref:NAD(P)/FAD-dependent oxidoreductase n=1 Tax=Actinomadura fibrosa TaxID=111802 RepID=A0ABW2XWN4_9ACTN|nr:FAD-binding oxidoreductase [Actinomadura fibrosa]
MTVPDRADAVVIGGGVIGLSAAGQLAAAGARTVLLERGELGSGASRATAGVLRAYFSGDPAASRLAVRSLAAYRRLPAAPPMRQVGYLVLLTDPEQAAAVEAELPAQRDAGVRVELIGAAEARRRNPLVDEPGLLAAAWSPQAYVSDTPAIVRALAGAAARAGAALCTDRAVTAVDAAAGRVHTAQGTVTARAIVCAAGAWSSWIAAEAGVDLPLTGPAVQELLAAPLPDVPDIPVTLHAASGLLVRKRGDGLLIGMGFPGPDRDAWLARTRAQLGRTYPGVDLDGLRSAVTGPRDASPDRSAFVGHVPGPPAFLYATGFSGRGLCHAPAAGELVRALYLGDDLAAGFGIDPGRLAAGPERCAG